MKQKRRRRRRRIKNPNICLKKRKRRCRRKPNLVTRMISSCVNRGLRGHLRKRYLQRLQL
jgi:hypothetical protein